MGLIHPSSEQEGQGGKEFDAVWSRSSAKECQTGNLNKCAAVAPKILA